MVLDAALLNVQHYKVRVKVKYSNPGNEISPSPTPRCRIYLKGCLRVTLDHGHQLYLFINIVFVYSLLNVKIVLFQTIKLSVSTVSMSKIVLFQMIQFSICTHFNVKTVLFQVIKFCINTQFIALRPIDRTTSGATTPGQSEPGQ